MTWNRVLIVKLPELHADVNQPPTLRRWRMDALSDRLRMGATAEGFPAAERTLQ